MTHVTAHQPYYPRRDFSPYLSRITSLPIESVLEDIREFKSDATFAVTQLNQPNQKAYLQKLAEGGIYPIILSYLKRCADETFEDVLGEDRVGQDEYIETPLVWVVFLTNSVTHLEDSDIRIEIVENIDTLFTCMRDDMTRELFKSTKYWYETYTTFLPLLLNLKMNNRKVLDMLLEKDGFLDMLIQTLFWPLCKCIFSKKQVMNFVDTMLSFSFAFFAPLQIVQT